MNFPKFWAFAQSGSFHSWQWSNTSVEDAYRKAQQTAQRIAQQFVREGRFMDTYYAERPLREPVLRELQDAVITRNSYGCQVLNTARAMFVDVDIAAPSAIAKAQAWASRQPGWNWRVYQTAAGLRLLATHALFDPADPICQTVFDAVDADPLYRKLCQLQECFRARLTPKPWRCESRNPPCRWPYPNQSLERAFQDWKARSRD